MGDTYEQAVIEWAQAYNGYARIGERSEAVDHLMSDLREVYQRDGVIPSWAGVDLLRGWAFFIVNEFTESGSHQSLFKRHAEINSILDAIRNHAGVRSDELPPIQAEFERGGHLFIIDGDLALLTCDAVLVPTDEDFVIEPYWHLLVTPGRLPLDWGSEPVMELPQEFRGSASDGKVKVWLGNVGLSGDQSGFSEFERKIGAFISAASRDRSSSSPKLRLALPVVGSREGGGHLRRGDLVKGIVRQLQRLAAADDVDIVLVTFGRKAYAAAQRARRELLKETDLSEAWRFANPNLIDDAKKLADKAIQRHLVLFLGAGVSAGAGLPTWNSLLDGVAADVGIDEDARQRLSKKDARDRATLIERRMKLDDRDFREEIADKLSAHRYSLQHGLLASLPSDEAVTTNFDSLFELAATTGDRKLAVLPDNPLDAGGRWLLKLHGSVGSPQRIILTRSDFLNMPRQYGALLGLVQGLLLMRHMMFVGYSLQDEDFHELIHEVRAARCGATGRGTILTLFEDKHDQELWSDDLEVVSMSEGKGPRNIPFAARQLELFLDLVGYYAATCSAFFLDDTYEELVTDKSEQAVRKLLMKLVEVTAGAAEGSVGFEVKEFLEKLGSDGHRGAAPGPAGLVHPILNSKPRKRSSALHRTPTFDDEIFDLVCAATESGELTTLRNSRKNRIAAVDRSGVYVETARSKDRGTGPQHVPAWMVATAWDHLRHHGVLSQQELLDTLNVKRSAFVCALLAKFPGVVARSTGTTVLEFVGADDIGSSGL